MVGAGKRGGRRHGFEREHAVAHRQRTRHTDTRDGSVVLGLVLVVQRPAAALSSVWSECVTLGAAERVDEK